LVRTGLGSHGSRRGGVWRLVVRGHAALVESER
jgi:hypothetical protein